MITSARALLAGKVKTVLWIRIIVKESIAVCMVCVQRHSLRIRVVVWTGFSGMGANASVGSVRDTTVHTVQHVYMQHTTW